MIELYHQKECGMSQRSKYVFIGIMIALIFAMLSASLIFTTNMVLTESSAHNDAYASTAQSVDNSYNK